MKYLTSKLTSLKNIYNNAKLVKKDYQKSIFEQFFELFILRFVGIHFDDYYHYSLFDSSLFNNFREKLSFRGSNYIQKLRIFSDVQIQGIAYHKHILYTLLNKWNVPCPKIYEIYNPSHNGFNIQNAIVTKNELIKYFKKTDKYPIFCKPSNASQGYGAIGILKKLNDNSVELITGQEINIDILADNIHNISQKVGTYILCEMLIPNDFFSKICGQTLTSLRIVILMKKGTPSIFRSLILLPSGKKHTSNFCGGSTGNLVAKVHVETGKISSVLSNTGIKRTYVSLHPDSNEQLESLLIPDWNYIKETVKNAAYAMSPFKMQHWDIALTNRGPVILEMNFIGDVDAFQLHGYPGIYTDEFKQFKKSEARW